MKEPRPVGEVWLSVEQTANILGVPRETVRRWARDGDARLPAYKVWDEGEGTHGRFRFKQSDVEAFQKSEEEASQAPPPAQDPAPQPAKRRRSAVAAG